MRIFTDMTLKNNKLILANMTDTFEGTPEVGEFAFVSGVLYIYSSIGGTLTWYPLTNKSEYYVHQQLSASSSWTINHNLNTQNLAYFVYDDAGNYQIANVSFTDDNNLTLDLVESITGRAVIFASANAYASGSSTIVMVDKYAEKQMNHGSVSGSIDISLNDGLVHLLTISGNTDITFSGFATGSRTSGVTVNITNGGNYTVTWPSSVKWPEGTEPVLSLDGRDRLVFVSDDGGTNIDGFVAGMKMS